MIDHIVDLAILIDLADWLGDQIGSSDLRCFGLCLGFVATVGIKESPVAMIRLESADPVVLVHWPLPRPADLLDIEVRLLDTHHGLEVFDIRLGTEALVANRDRLNTGLIHPLGSQVLQHLPALAQVHLMASAIKQIFVQVGINTDHGEGGIAGSASLRTRIVTSDVYVERVWSHVIRSDPFDLELLLGSRQRVLELLTGERADRGIALLLVPDFLTEKNRLAIERTVLGCRVDPRLRGHALDHLAPCICEVVPGADIPAARIVRTAEVQCELPCFCCLEDLVRSVDAHARYHIIKDQEPEVLGDWLAVNQTPCLDRLLLWVGLALNGEAILDRPLRAFLARVLVEDLWIESLQELVPLELILDLGSECLGYWSGVAEESDCDFRISEYFLN